jgi:hypothetical protein
MLFKVEGSAACQALDSQRHVLEVQLCSFTKGTFCQVSPIKPDIFFALV